MPLDTLPLLSLRGLKALASTYIDAKDIFNQNDRLKNAKEQKWEKSEKT